MDEIRMLALGGKGYACSQMLLKMALEMRGEENPGLVRAMGGLAYGCGDGSGTCGALTGGCCLLALYAGRGSDAESESERLPLMLGELTAWFRRQVADEYGGALCEEITGEAGPPAVRERCGRIVAGVFEKAMEILVSNDIDPYTPA